MNMASVSQRQRRNQGRLPLEVDRCDRTHEPPTRNHARMRSSERSGTQRPSTLSRYMGEDTVEFFNLVLQLQLVDQEKKDLVDFMQAL